MNYSRELGRGGSREETTSTWLVPNQAAAFAALALLAAAGSAASGDGISARRSQFP